MSEVLSRVLDKANGAKPNPFSLPDFALLAP